MLAEQSSQRQSPESSERRVPTIINNEGKRPFVKTEDGTDDTQSSARRVRLSRTTDDDDERSAVETVRDVSDMQEDATLQARKRAYEARTKTPQQTAAERHDEAYLYGASRAAEEPSSSSHLKSTAVPMPVSRQWVRERQPKVSDEQLKRMIVEMTEVNKSRWSHETIRSVTGGPRGDVQHVMASLSQGELSDEERTAFNLLDFGEADDPIQPDWGNMQRTGVLDKIREAKTRVYAEGSQPKIKTTLNHWMRYVATRARVSFLRPRVGDDPDAFLTESLLRQGFIAYLVEEGCNVDTATGYASLFNGWHIDTMGYGLVSTNSFEDEQFKRTNQGLRRLHPAKKLERAAHQAELNEAVLRPELKEMFEIYDEPGPMTSERWARIERELSSSGRPDDLDHGKTKALVYSALTELMTDGLLRPGEGIQKKGFISQADITFDRGEDGRVKSATVMIVPIKLKGAHVEDTSKKPILIKADRGGALRSAELLDILNHVCPCERGEEATTPMIRFPVERMQGLNKTQQKSLKNITMPKVMKWFHAKCEAAGVPQHELIMPHSFRIAGATMLFRMGVTADEIKTMGRWFSDVYRIYCRLSKERLLELSEKMGSARSTQFVNGARGFFDTLLEVEPVEARPAGGGSGSSVPSEERGDAEDERSDCMSDDAASEESDCMSDDEFERLCGTTAATAPTPAPAPTIESLFDLDDDE